MRNPLPAIRDHASLQGKHTEALTFGAMAICAGSVSKRSGALSAGVAEYAEQYFFSGYFAVMNMTLFWICRCSAFRTYSDEVVVIDPGRFLASGAVIIYTAFISTFEWVFPMMQEFWNLHSSGPPLIERRRVKCHGLDAISKS